MSLILDEEQAVREANQLFYRAFESLDLARMDDAWWHDGQVSCIHPGWPLAFGWQEVRGTWRTIFANTSAIRFSVADERVDVRDELAWLLCTERIGSSATGGPSEAAVLATNVFRREAGVWRLVHHHGSGIAVPARAPSVDRSPPPRKGPLN